MPSLGLWSARALAKLGKLVEASDRYAEVSGLPVGSGDANVQKQAQADAQVELQATQLRIPSVVIRLVGAAAGSVAVSIDGKLFDMSGNVMEWTDDCFDGFCVIRGAEFYVGDLETPQDEQRCTWWYNINQPGDSDNVGLRCCSTP